MRKKLKGKLQKPTAELLEDVVIQNTSDMVQIKDIIVNINHGGFALMMLVFSLPILVPLPPPLPSFISLPLLIFSFQMMIGLDAPKIPNFMGNKKIKRKLLAKIIEESVFQLRKSERFIKSRWSFIFGIIHERIIGFLSFIFALSILVPLPLTNLLPGISILIISLGLLSKDGLLLILGLVIGILGISMTTFIVIFGIEGIILIKDSILNFIL